MLYVLVMMFVVRGERERGREGDIVDNVVCCALGSVQSDRRADFLLCLSDDEIFPINQNSRS